MSSQKNRRCTKCSYNPCRCRGRVQACVVKPQACAVKFDNYPLRHSHSSSSDIVDACGRRSRRSHRSHSRRSHGRRSHSRKRHHSHRRCRKPSCRGHSYSSSCSSSSSCNVCEEAILLNADCMAQFRRSLVPPVVPTPSCPDGDLAHGTIVVNLLPKDGGLCRPQTHQARMLKNCCSVDECAVKLQVKSSSTCPESGTGLPVYFMYCKLIADSVTSFLIRAPTGHNIGTWSLEYSESRSCASTWTTAYGPVSSTEDPTQAPEYDIVCGLQIQLPRPICNARWRIKIETLGSPTRYYVQLSEFSLFHDPTPCGTRYRSCSNDCCCRGGRRDRCRCRYYEYHDHRRC